MSYRVLHRDETAVGASRHDDLVGADPPSEAVDVGSPLLVREWRTTPTCATASGIEHEDAVANEEGVGPEGDVISADQIDAVRKVIADRIQRVARARGRKGGEGGCVYSEHS